MKTAKFCLCVLAVFLAISCRKTTIEIEEEEAVPPPQPSTLAILDDPEAQRELFLAFADAYPDKISGVEFRNDDWSMLVNGRRFYFANGRLLPERLRDQWENYLPYDFYPYPWTGSDRERQAAFDHPVYSIGSAFLFDTLYSSPSEDESWDLQEKYSFLGVKMLVHAHIIPLLDRITAQIRRVSGTDQSVKDWIAELQTSPPTFGWNWRSIAGTSRRSNHSYGTAVDLLPRDLKGRLTYWRWDAEDTGKEPVYYLPPDAVIQIFEDHGFIWGGKWDLIDTMHFEYRPEILLLNGFTVLSFN
jgi:hypothetical protein